MQGPKSRVYEATLQQIRLIIKKDGLLPGDKIPSERELADRLNVGRSSVREALRALELLGMIETRRGEGTFIKDFKENHLVNVLGLFVLEDSKAVEDILEMSELIEKHALLKILQSSDEKKLVQLERDFRKGIDSPQELMGKLIHMAGNHLLFRTWSVLADYLKAGSDFQEPPVPVYEELMSGLVLNNKSLVLQAYDRISKYKIISS
ncbi:FadR family transcriptional regulator [Bacillus sp. FJAT-42376]|uniref:FadR/GntR family transcriptional regulator n=1 Tax=Bacillus sp. FJAT-42376 TaxID=2014076 RepID=UPI000F516A9B|nr:GntR family transcriptional regulator [Bacillus sp. FJAT-42376]AZB43913.1 FadR family transcriptional regulator [Bacillus sp. FJAT-42376]